MNSVLLAGRDHAIGFAQVAAERLLDDDVLAGARRGDGRIAVEVVRKAEIDELDVRPLVELLVACEGVRDAMALREGSSSFPVG